MTRVLIDDRRRFDDDRACVIYRGSAAAVAGLRAMAEAGVRVDELWLDYDLGGGDTIAPVLAMLADLADAHRRLEIRATTVLAASASGAQEIVSAMTRLGYPHPRSGRDAFLSVEGD